MIEDLDRLIAKLKKLGDLPRQVAPQVAIELRKTLEANIKAGKAPDGSSWAMRQDGGRPLENAAKALTVTANGTVIVARLTGPEALHHRGAVKGGKRRQILPSKDSLEPVIAAVKKVIHEAI